MKTASPRAWSWAALMHRAFGIWAIMSWERGTSRRPPPEGARVAYVLNTVAFSKAVPLGARINAIYSSDIGHFDVVDRRDPLPEVFELVEDGGLITEEDSRDFVFANAVRLWGTQNPRFFEARR
ncbi:MAG TPA: hypothetical protein VEV39_06460 [Gemmatimonadales bacterium]|nr:hypothetical protein [Gemmatimonadales bacterium]